jgi:hypothetical protein
MQVFADWRAVMANAVLVWVSAMGFLFPACANDPVVTPPVRGPVSEVTASTPATKKILLVAGRPSHPPRMHEFNAGVQLLARCLKESGADVEVQFTLNGWPKDESLLREANAIVFYMDGGGGHEVVQEGGCMHYAVEVVSDQAGKEFKRWIGGHYEHMFSCNPIWEPEFSHFPEHPITRGVQPFRSKDEWYFNMRFVNDIPGGEPTSTKNETFTPILVASPSDDVRDGPYVYPPGPYAHIEAHHDRAEAMMWAIERSDGGRGFGFTGGHFHDNWGNDSFRKVILNACLWLAKVEVPAEGVASTVSPDQLEANLDPKGKK